MIREFKPAYPRFEELQKQLIDIATLQDLENIHSHPDGQLAVQTDGSDDLHNGVGSSRGKDKEWERSFNKIHPMFKDTLIEDYFSWLGVPVHRARIMCAREKGCYSLHKDLSPRLHLPLKTNNQCFFLLGDHDVNSFEKISATLYHLPADGKTTWIDTRNVHTFINGSTERRLHLVMIVDE